MLSPNFLDCVIFIAGYSFNFSTIPFLAVFFKPISIFILITSVYENKTHIFNPEQINTDFTCYSGCNPTTPPGYNFLWCLSINPHNQKGNPPSSSSSPCRAGTTTGGCRVAPVVFVACGACGTACGRVSSVFGESSSK